MILRRVLSAEDAFGVGLDVGCGTGHSAIALADHCERVHAIDPSPAMLAAARPHPRVRYASGSAERISLPDGSVEVVTCAGSLPYIARGAGSREIRRVVVDGAVVIAYDFEVLLRELLQRFQVETEAISSGYDHGANFAGAAGYQEVTVGMQRVRVEAGANDLAHLILSDSNRLDLLSRRYGVADPFPALAETLRTAPDLPLLEADLYYSRYRITAT